MTTKLQLFNTALRFCGERKIASLTEDREPRRLLDDVYETGGIDTCLEEALWKFALRSSRIDFDQGVTPDFGYRRAFSKPSDWVSTASMCSDEYYNTPLLQYHHENDYWYADIDEIYVQYISNHTDYGYNLGLWPASFADYVAAHFASEIVWKLTSNGETVQRVEALLDRYRKKAKNKDAQQQAQRFPAPGNWVTSRGNTLGRTRDRGSRSQLIG